MVATVLDTRSRFVFGAVTVLSAARRCSIIEVSATIVANGRWKISLPRMMLPPWLIAAAPEILIGTPSGLI